MNANALSILKMSTIGEEKMMENQFSNEQYGNEAGKSLLQSTESTVRFKVIKAEVDKNDEKCLESSEFKLNDVIWKVKVCKKSIRENEKDTDETEYASVVLESVFKEETSAWSCEAEVAVKLIGKDGKNLDGKITPNTYSRTNSAKSNDKFIKWDDLKDNFLDKNTATFDFNVVTKTLNRTPKVEQTTAKFMLRVKQINDNLSEYSNELTVRGIRWRVYASKIGNFFAIFVEANDNDIDTKAKWAVTTNFKLLSSTKDKTMERHFDDRVFDWTRTNLGFTEYLEWAEFIKADNGFVRNGAALVEITLKVEPKTT